MSNAPLAGRTYHSVGNKALLKFMPPDAADILDVGCGAGDDARLLHERGCRVVGVTLSRAEAELAGPHCSRVIVADVEREDLDLPEQSFDVLLLSHVLEHMVDPSKALVRLARHLKPNGLLLIAIPNMAHWRLRLRFLWGNWRRETEGPMDRTHLHFFSFDTAPALLQETPYTLIRHDGEFSLPLWLFRRAFRRVSAGLDSRIGRLRPNLFAGQTLLVARKT